MGRGQLNLSGHAISDAVMPQRMLEHHVFAYDSFIKSGELIIETSGSFVAVSISGVMGTFQVAVSS